MFNFIVQLTTSRVWATLVRTTALVSREERLSIAHVLNVISVQCAKVNLYV